MTGALYLSTKDKVHRSGQPRRKCRSCAPNVDELAARSTRGDPKQIMARSLNERHVGGRVTRDGTDLGEVLGVGIAVVTADGVHVLSLDKKIVVTYPNS